MNDGINAWMCVKRGTNEWLSPTLHDSEESAQRAIDFFSKDHFKSTAVCRHCGKPDQPPQENPWVYAEVRVVSVSIT